MQQALASGWRGRGVPEPEKAAPKPRQLTVKGKTRGGKEVDIAVTRAPGHPVAQDLQRVKVERTKKGYRIRQQTKEGEIVTHHPELQDAIDHMAGILNTHQHVRGGKLGMASLALFG